MTRSLFVIALPLYVGPEQAGFLCTGKGFEARPYLTAGSASSRIFYPIC